MELASISYKITIINMLRSMNEKSERSIYKQMKNLSREMKTIKRNDGNSKTEIRHSNFIFECAYQQGFKTYKANTDRSNGGNI